jgi:hypothetical protein
MTTAANLAQYANNSPSWRNRIINGAMQIDQRNAGASVTPTSAGYTLDRWFLSSFGTSFNSTTIRQLSANSPTGFSNYVQITAGSTTATNLYLSQSIETANCYDLAGETVTLSFWYRVPVSSTNRWQAQISFSTSANTKTTDASGGNLLSITDLTNTTTWTKASITATIPSNAQTVGCMFVNGYNNVVNGAQFQITGVQLEKGTTATNFEYRDYGRELIMCQRYYEKSFEQATAPANSGSGTALLTVTGMATGWSINNAFGGMMIKFSVTKRATPTITPFGNSSGHWFAGAWGSLAAAIAASDNGFFVNQQQVGGMNLTYGHWTASAEL